MPLLPLLSLLACASAVVLTPPASAGVGGAPDAAVAALPLGRAAFQATLRLPLRSDNASVGAYKVVLVAREGAPAVAAAAGICAGVEAAFDVGAAADGAAAWRASCPERAAAAVREARALDLQHDARYADEVQQLHERLSASGLMVGALGEASVWAAPFRAAALARLAAALPARLAAAAAGGGGASADAAGAAPPLHTVCETGFGAGHSALLFLLAAPAARVHSFDRGDAPHALPAHDWLDARFPGRLALYVGEDAAPALPRLREAWPGDACQLMLVDGGASYADVAADLAALRRLADARGHAVALAGAAEGSEALRAWQDAVAAGALAWELSFAERPAAHATSDRLVAGHFRPA
jgi:hypothetical protein